MKLKAYRHRRVKYGPKNKPLDGNSPENKELSFSELSHLLRIMSIPMSMFYIVKIPVYLYTFIYMCFLRLSNTFKHASVCEFSKYLEFDVRICITSSNEMITRNTNTTLQRNTKRQKSTAAHWSLILQVFCENADVTLLAKKTKHSHASSKIPNTHSRNKIQMKRTFIQRFCTFTLLSFLCHDIIFRPFLT